MANIPLKSLTFPGLDDTYTIPQIESLAPAYIQSNAYHIGDFVTHDNKLYRCTTDTTAGEAWTLNHWTESSIDTSIDELTAIGYVRYDVAQSLTNAEKTQARNNIGAVEVDATLTQTGKAADAKKTGDEITALRSDLNVLEPAASASDVGKALKAKTVSGGKVTAYEFGDAVTIDPTLTQSGQAADAKKTGDEIADLKDDFNDVVLVTPQTLTDAQKAQVKQNIGIDEETPTEVEIDLYTTIPSVGTTLYTSDDVDEGDKIVYSITMPRGGVDLSTGYIELFDSSDTRIVYYGRGASADTTTVFNGNFLSPSNFSYAKWNGHVSPTALSIKRVTTQAVSNGMLFKGQASSNQILFTKRDVSVGEVIYFDFNALTGESGYLDFYNDSNQRIIYFGKGSNLNTNNKYVGALKIPEGFSYCKWGSNSYGDIKYIQTLCPISTLTSEYNKRYKVDLNLLEHCEFTDNYAIRAYDGATISNSATCITSYIPVVPGSLLSFPSVVSSPAGGNGTAFYNEQLEFVNCEMGHSQEILVPENAYYARFTLLKTSKSNASLTIISLSQINNYNNYVRQDIHRYGTRYGIYNHVAFTSMEILNGKFVVAYRCATKHLNYVTDAGVGVIQFDGIYPDGSHEHIHTYNATDFGLSGDIRDCHLRATKDGLYLLACFGVGTSTSGTSFNKMDTCIACFDKNLTLIDYVVFNDVWWYPFGSPLITPEGHILLSVFDCKNLAKSGVMRSNQVFNGSVSGFTFDYTDVCTTTEAGGTISEMGIGYFNDELVAVTRCESTSPFKTVIRSTDNLEGTSGWGNPVIINIRIDSPKLLPYRKGNYLPVFGSTYYAGTVTRNPSIAYLNQDLSLAFYGYIDEDLIPARNGYPGFVDLGNETYAVAYYQESPVTDVTQWSIYNSFTGLYYKWVNARTVCPQLNYVDIN